MRLIGRVSDERGFTMAVVAIAGAFISIVSIVAVTAVKGDLRLTRNDLAHKQAYEAARAGLNDYLFHLNQDTDYWTRCESVPNPSAVNRVGTTAKRRPVPGSTNASYAIELLPANGRPYCDQSDPVMSMIEQSGAAAGTFRLRSTGYADTTEQSIVATFRRSSFLDYLYFTQLETSDPVTYGDPDTIAGAYQQCTKTIAQGREDAPIPNSGGRYCNRIYFIDDEQIRGPLHTNDALNICGDPTFGRSPVDAIEVSSPPQGWRQGCAGSPNFVGTFTANSPILTPPPTNSKLRTIADPAYRFTGQVRIVLNANNTMTVSSNLQQPGTTIPMPPNGVVYVANDPNRACSTAYDPFTVDYSPTSGCGNVYVKGTYSSRLTIAAENDIIIDGNVVRSGAGMLGLIANNFVRVYHQFTSQTAQGQCNGGANDPPINGSSSPNRIDAAILAIQHSFIVDHYDCGAALGNLTVNGAIAQKFRGPVGTFGSRSTGYRKDYNYDDRLRYVSPPHFLDPVQSSWKIRRETLD